jgi:hypothetical protein
MNQIKAKTRKLSAKWSIEAAFDLKSMQENDILAQLLEKQLRYELRPEEKYTEIV